MKKLTMKVDDLRVESFDVQAENRARRGTVQANIKWDDGTRLECVISAGCDSLMCYESMGCTFTANVDCMESMNCPA